jgi:methyl-accepting chemotaxis protein
VADAWDNLASARSSLGRFAESRDVEEGKKSHAYLDTMGEELEKMSSLLQTREGRALYDSLNQTRGELLTALTRMEELFAEANTSIETLLGGAIAMRGTLIKLNDDVTAARGNLGLTILDENEGAQLYMMGISLGGVILGILFASFIIIGIVGVLNKLASFAGSISRGDFAQKLDISEGGEIGAMAEAMREIPKVLNKVTSGANNLANAILSGGFRKRLDTHEFAGSYADIAQSVNSVSDAYTGVIDNLPIPVLSFDANHTPLFLNEKAQQTFDGNEQPLEPGEDPKMALGIQAMQAKSPQTTETALNAKGQRMIASMTAMPLFNMEKSVVGYFGIINDLTEIRTQQSTMLDVAQQASQISDRVAAASEQLAAQVEQISRGAEIQRERVESTASAMTEMNSTVLEVAQNAGQASEQSEDTRHKAEDGAELVNRVVRAINTVNTVAVGLQGNMQDLGNQAENIGGIMNVISDIADHTNLLALNAAIEAARAGEAGRGFAVVADEVRKLAEKTMTATQEVGSSISAIQNSARHNIDEVGSAVTNVTEATELANASGSALNEIVTLAAANSAVVASIATAAEQQSATSEEISRALEEINGVVGETTEGIIQSSSAVQDLSRMAQELRQVMDHLK